MRNTAIACLAMFCGLMAGPPALSQEWSPTQKEVWKNVETYLALNAAGDLEGFLSYVHQDYIGWDIREPMASDKSRLRKFLDYSHKNYKIELEDSQPVSINIIDDVAIVYYHFTGVAKDADGKRSEYSGRWSDVLKKQGDRWVLIGDHGGVTSEE